MISSKIFERLVSSDEFRAQFGGRNPSLKKQVGLYEIESISNANIVTIAVNSKEYFEKYKDKSINKKHEGLKKDTSGMHFEAYADRIMSLNEFMNWKLKKLNKTDFK